MIYFSTLLLSMFITIGLTPILIRLATKLNLLDVPSDRKVHQTPIPRIGGLSIAFGVLVPFLIHPQYNQISTAIFIGAFIIVVFGALDDFFGLDYRVKFAGQIAAALVLILYGGFYVNNLGSCLPENCQLPGWLAFSLTLLVIVGVTNAVNLADGLDGLAGGIMMQVFVGICLLGYLTDNHFVVLFALAIIGSIFGFLRYNTHPATIFMGDTGSQLLGFLAIALALSVTRSNITLSPFLPLLLLGFPVLDTIVVMGERIKKGRPPFVADKNHFHHKLLALGLFHSETVFLVYAIQALFVASAYVLRYYSEWFILGYYLILVLFVLVPFYYAYDIGFTFNRTNLVDNFFQNRLWGFFKKRVTFLKVLQPAVLYGFPLLFFFSVCVPAEIPLWLSVLSFLLCAAMGVGFWRHAKWCAGGVRIATYVLLPLVLFQSMQQMAPWSGSIVLKLFAIFYAVIAVLTVLLLKLTRRKVGFRATPTDFLIVLIAFGLTKLPSRQFTGDQVSFWGTCLIVFFFGVEVILGELRDKSYRICLLFLPALVVLAVRGML